TPRPTSSHLPGTMDTPLLERRPQFLRRLSTDEFSPQPYSEADRRVLARVRELLAAADRGLPRRFENRAVTAAGLLALNREWGAPFYRLPPEAVADDAAAAEALRGDGVVIDVQTH